MTTMAAMNTVDTASFQVSFISGTSSERAKTPASISPPGAIPARVQGQHGAEKGPGLLPGGQVLGSWEMTLPRSSAECHGSAGGPTPLTRPLRPRCRRPSRDNPKTPGSGVSRLGGPVAGESLGARLDAEQHLALHDQAARLHEQHVERPGAPRQARRHDPVPADQ